jgi:glycosyltransferase involved in cell wall biosynthesis
VAERCGLPLVLAGIVQDQAYFDELVAPRIDGERVRFIGAVGPTERSGLLGGAHALLHLIGFEEPFGYSVVEAMACGTPAIAFRRGSMPELIADGTTGFLVDEIEGAVAAVGRSQDLDRAVIRAEAVARFGIGRMVEAYIAVYEQVARDGV